MRVHRQIGQPSVSAAHSATDYLFTRRNPLFFSFLFSLSLALFPFFIPSIPAYSVLLANPRKRSSLLAFVAFPIFLSRFHLRFGSFSMVFIVLQCLVDVLLPDVSYFVCDTK